MPTGYTDEIAKGITFKEFALNCARAFGACVTMRDDPPSTEIPDEFEPSGYAIKELKKAKKKLAEINSMSTEEAQTESEREYTEARNQYNKGIKNKIALKEKYEDMLLSVKKWKPPSEEHEDFKKFMIDQIEKSIEFDCSTKYDDEFTPKPLGVDEWRTRAIAKSFEDIVYYTNENEKEIARVAKRNLWIKQLRESIKEDKC